MMLRKLFLTTAAAALVVAPLGAQAAAPARASSPVAEAEGLSQELMLLLGAVFFGLLVLIFADNGDEPVSP